MKKVPINSKKRYATLCVKCGKKYEDDNLGNIPWKCCKQDLIINDNKLLLSNIKDILSLR